MRRGTETGDDSAGVARLRPDRTSFGVRFDDRLGFVVRAGHRAFERDRVMGMARVGFGPASGGTLVEKRLTGRTAPTGRDPGGHVVGVVTGVALMIERELFYGAVTGTQLVEFVLERPLPIAPGAGHGRNVVYVAGVDWRKIGIAVGIGHGGG